MAMNPEQFDLYIKEKTNELAGAWKAIPPTEMEVLTKAIIDYQHKATIATLEAIEKVNAVNYNNWVQIMNKLEKIEADLKK